MNTAIVVALVSLLGGSDTLMLTMDQAIRMALKQNKDILVEEKNVHSSIGDVLIQRGVFDPVLEFEVSYTDEEIPTASTFIESGSVASERFDLKGGISGKLPIGLFYELMEVDINRTNTDSPLEDITPSWTTTVSFTLGQELLRGFGTTNLANLRVAGRNRDISGRQLEIIISETLVRVEAAYWRLVAAYKIVELAQTALDLAHDLERRNEIQVEVGVLPPVSVTQARSEVAARRVDFIQADNNLKRTEDELKNLLSIPLSVIISAIDEPQTLMIEIEEGAAISTALVSRPEIAQSNLVFENTEELKGFYRNQMLPRLAVQGTLGFSGLGGDENTNRLVFGDGSITPISDDFNSSSDAFRQVVQGDFPTWQVLATFSFPLFNSSARGEYRKAVADYERSLIERSRTIDTVNLDVKNSIRQVRNSQKQVDAGRVSVELAREVLRNEEERLRVGIGTTRDVLEAQRDAVDARLAEITAITEYNIALAEFERAKGTDLDHWGIDVMENRELPELPPWGLGGFLKP